MEENKEPPKKAPASPFARVFDNTYYPPNKIEVRLSADPTVGIGVYATVDIAKDDLIERCPMVQLDFRSRYHSDPQLSRYLYNDQGCKCDQCAIHGHHMFMVLGYGMIYNHQNEPSAQWKFDFPKLIGDVMALKDIAAGEEIFVSYGDKYFKKRPYVDYTKKETTDG